MKPANKWSNHLQNTTRSRRRGQPRQAAKGDARQQGGTGNARRHYERYVVLAHEAATNGDEVEMENCCQHAEHYHRILNGRE